MKGLSIEPRIVVPKIEEFIRERTKNTKGVVVGISGGVDSAVVACLCKNALGKDRVYGILMPSSTTSREDLEDSRGLVKILGIENKEFNIDNLEKEFSQAGLFSELLSKGNLKARIRMCLLYGAANSMNKIVAGTGNKSELMIGYFTKYGDGGVDFLPIGDLYKTQVFELAKHLGVPARVIEKDPTAGLWNGQTDEAEMGVTYKVLDQILLGLELGIRREFIARAVKVEDKLVEKVIKMYTNSEHKRRIPEVCELR